MLHHIIYHKDCLDGFGSAYLVANHVTELDHTVHLIPATYDTREEIISSLNLQPKGEIWILDFSFTTEQFLRLKDLWKKEVIWIDHHATAIADVNIERITEAGVKSYISPGNTQSGIGLTWDYLYSGGELGSCPDFVLYIQDRDLWKFNCPETKSYCLALSQVPQNRGAWNEFLGEYTTSEIISVGNNLEDYFNTQLHRAILQTKETCTIQGIKGLVCNLPPMFASEAGNILAAESGTFGATYYKTREGKIAFSLRSIGDFDVSKIAKEFGGGGHKNAAGFILDETNSVSASAGVTI